MPGVMNPARADDLVQETILKAIVRMRTLQDEDALRPWLYRIMTNCHRDWLRRQRDTVDVDELELACEDCPKRTPSGPPPCATCASDPGAEGRPAQGRHPGRSGGVLLCRSGRNTRDSHRHRDESPQPGPSAAEARSCCRWMAKTGLHRSERGKELP
jgi:RNA polymerase sigma factor (sigma-70 family)